MKKIMPLLPPRRETNKGAWNAEEDQKLAQVIETHGPRRWKSLALKAGLNRCGKSCRLRWMNYLRPNIKRGNISDQEEDLILRLHKLLGNRWTLIAGRLPGRTDNEIKNYWNSHLSKKMKQNQRPSKGPHPGPFQSSTETDKSVDTGGLVGRGGDRNKTNYNSSLFREDDQFFDFANEGPMNLEWMSRFLEIDEL